MERATWQRTLGARYDGAHALLVRLVHPAAFAALVLTLWTVLVPVGVVLIELFADDGGSIAFTAAVIAITVVVAAFTFVLTLVRGIVTVVLLVGWSLLLAFDVTPGGSYLDVVWGIAAASIVLQVVLLVRVVPRRWRAGLLHLLPAATIGTALGAIPVWFGLRAALANDDAAAEGILLLTFLAASVVILLLLALHAVVRWRDAAVLREFSSRHGFHVRQVGAHPEVPAGIAALVPEFANVTRFHEGRLQHRAAVACTGYTMGRSPDVPSLHLTVVALELKRSGPALWVRRRDVSHDNLLVGTDHSGVLRLESISFDERWTVRFEAGADDLESHVTFGPQLIDLLDRSLGEGQVCRIGSHVCGWIVGGACSADELDALAETLHAFARIVEGHTPARSAPADAAPA